MASPVLAQPFTGRLMILDAANHQVHVFDLASEEVVETFAVTQSMAPGFGTSLARTSNGRLGLVVQRSGHFANVSHQGRSGSAWKSCRKQLCATPRRH
jgi:hypothetical protein